MDEVEIRNFAFGLLKEIGGKATADDIQRYLKLRLGKKVYEEDINKALEKDKRFRKVKNGEKEFWTLTV
jgi:hypothetical protein